MIPLLVDLETEWRGGQNQFYLLLKGLYERGHAAELLTANGSSLGRRASKAGICVHHCSRGTFRLPAALKIHRLLRDGRFDVVHVNESHALTAAWLARAPRKVPLLISRRVGYPIGQSYLSRARFRSAAKIIANSQWVAGQAALSGVPRENLTVIYEGVEIPEKTSSEARQAARARWNVQPREPLLGCSGALLEDKGQEWVVRALPKLRDEFPGCRLLLAGEGAFRPTLEALTRELKLQDAVIFAGFVSDIESVYRALDVFVFPALFEGLGTSLLAAMAHSIPCVTYFGCALGEIVEDGKCGLQVQPKNPEALAEAIGKILRNHEFAGRLGEAAKERTTRLFSAERMIDETVKLYRDVSR